LSDSTRQSALGRGITARSLVLGFVCACLNTFFLVKCLYTSGGPAWQGPALLYNAVTALLLLALLNKVVKQWRPPWALGSGEMLTVYVLLVASTGLVGNPWSVGGALAAIISYPFGPSALGTGWHEGVWPHLPTWLTVRHGPALEGYWYGESGPYQWSTIKVWLVPALWWASFVGALMSVCLCLNSVVRKRWADEEKLAFPLTIVPLQLADERFGLLRNRAFWIAAAISFGLILWDGLARALPSLPRIPLGFDPTPYVRHRPPWDLLGNPVGWEPAMIGLCYLMPLDLAFSLFLFSVLANAAIVLAAYYGWSFDYSGGTFPYLPTQIAGGTLALAFGFLWLDRRFLVQVLKQAVRARSPFDQTERREAFSYRTAVLGVVLALGYLVWFWTRAGVPGWIAVAFFGIYFTVMIVLSRVRAQLGPPSYSYEFAMPDRFLRHIAGTAALGPKGLGMLYLLFPFLYWQDNHPTAIQLEALKMSEGGRMQRRRIALALAVVAPVTVLWYFWAQLHFGYRLGLVSARSSPAQYQVGHWLTQALDAAIRQPTKMNIGATLAMGVGALVTLALLGLKLRFHWWPLHPVAFPIAYCWQITYLTPVIFVTWLLRALILRYGGLRAHQTALPVFLGMLIGDFTATALRTLIFPSPGS